VLVRGHGLDWYTLNRWAALCTMSGGTWHCRATSRARLSVLLPGTILQVGTRPPIPAKAVPDTLVTHQVCDRA